MAAIARHHAELASSVAAMVNALPESYREALYLTDYQGLSQRDLASRLGLSFSGAKSRVQRATQTDVAGLLPF